MFPKKQKQTTKPAPSTPTSIWSERMYAVGLKRWMAEQLGALATLSEDLGMVPIIHIHLYNWLQLQLDAI